MQAFCSWVIVALLVIGFMTNAYKDFHGIAARRPSGFPGFVATVVVTVVASLLYYGAGAFDAIIGGK